VADRFDLDQQGRAAYVGAQIDDRHFGPERGAIPGSTKLSHLMDNQGAGTLPDAARRTD
jgi:hypothetical protein